MNNADDMLPGVAVEDSNWDIYRRLLVYLRPLKFYFFLSVLGNAIYAGASAYMAKALDFVMQTIEHPTDENRNKAEAIIAKQRNGPTGSCELVFLKEWTRFENPEFHRAEQPVF